VPPSVGPGGRPLGASSSHLRGVYLFRIRPPDLFSLSLLRRPLSSTLFPYTTLFRSSFRIEYRGEAASLLSRGAATECSPRRKPRSEEHTSELQSLRHLVCRLLLEKKNKTKKT